MSNVYRFTGPPENWLTGLQIKRWAVNSNNEGVWRRLKAGDIALFHSTRTSRHSSKARSVIIGYAVIGEAKWVKDDLWWSDEVEESQNKWPFVFSLSEIYLFKSLPELDLNTPVHQKTDTELAYEIELLSDAGVSVSELTKRAKELNPETPAFPVNGSASGVNPVYEDLLLKSVDEFYSLKGDDTSALEMNLAEEIDTELSSDNLEKLLQDAKSFKNTEAGYFEKEGVFVVRRDNEVQKRRIAAVENHTCQVCGFNCEYKRKNGKPGWIVDVDHIIDKKDGGNEEVSNLWVLCPNCHRKKSRGVITIDPHTYEVRESNSLIQIRDNHLLQSTPPSS